MEEAVSTARRWCHEQSTLSQDALSQHGKVGGQNWHDIASSYSAAGREHGQHVWLIARELIVGNRGWEMLGENGNPQEFHSRLIAGS